MIDISDKTNELKEILDNLPSKFLTRCWISYDDELNLILTIKASFQKPQLERICNGCDKDISKLAHTELHRNCFICDECRKRLIKNDPDNEIICALCGKETGDRYSSHMPNGIIHCPECEEKIRKSCLTKNK